MLTEITIKSPPGGFKSRLTLVLTRWIQINVPDAHVYVGGDDTNMTEASRDIGEAAHTNNFRIITEQTRG